MKKSVLALAIALGVTGLVNIDKAMAQSTDNSNISGEMGNPASIPGEKVLKVLFFRTHSVSIDTHIADMEADGVTERAFVAGFTMEGALAYDHELAGDDLLPNNTAGRNAGLQLVPYKVSLANDGRVYISTSAVAFKNMNSEVQDDDLDMMYNSNGGGWSVIDNLSAINFEYNKDVARGIEEKRFTIASVDIKLGIIESANENFFIALTGGATPLGWHETNFKELDGGDRTIKGFETELRYGAQFALKTQKGWRVDGGVGFKNRWSYDNHHVSTARMNNYNTAVDQYNTDLSIYNQNEAAYQNALAQYQAGKDLYEQQQGYNEPISDESYGVITGNTKPTFTDEKPNEPKAPDNGQSIRSLFLMTPSLNVSKNISKPGKRPVRIGVGVSGNIPLGDIMSGELNDNMTYRGNQALVTGRIFINF